LSTGRRGSRLLSSGGFGLSVIVIVLTVVTDGGGGFVGVVVVTPITVSLGVSRGGMVRLFVLALLPLYLDGIPVIILVPILLFFVLTLTLTVNLHIALTLGLLFDLGFLGVEIVRVIGRLRSSGTFRSRHFLGEEASLWVVERRRRVEAVVVVEVEAEAEVSHRR
jgi:hypothetical protein